MAADPIAAANALAGQTYASAQDRTTAGKKALLDGLAANGTYQNEINGAAIKAAAPAPVQPHAGDSDPRLASMSTAQADQTAQIGQAAVAAAAALAAHQQAAQQQASTTYFDQASAAIPVEQSRATSQAQQIMAELVAQREQEQAQKEQAALSLQIQREQLQGARESRAAAAKANDPKTMAPDDKYALTSAMEQKAVDSAIPVQYAIHDADGNFTGFTPGGNAISDVINGGLSVDAAARKNGITSPKALQIIQQQAQSYYDYLDRNGYYGIVGGTKPSIAAPSVGPVTGLLGGLYNDSVSNLAPAVNPKIRKSGGGGNWS